MAETKEERRARIQKEVAAESEARRKAYFEEQEKAKAGAAAIAPTLPEADAYRYNYAWRQDVGGPEGELKLVKSPNPYYDPSTNTIVDPATGERKPAVQSMWSGPTTFRAGTTGTTTVTKTSSTVDPYAAKYAAGYGIDAQGNQYRGTGTTVDPMTINGQPFTGVWQGKSYQNGILVTPTSGTGDTGGTGETVTYTAPDGRIFTSLTEYNAYLDKLKTDQKRQFGESAFQIFRSFLAQFGLEALAADVEKYKLEGLSDDELLLRLRTESAAYKRRFAANEKRTAAGLMALSEAEYIGLEDQYQNVMRRYGLPESYYTRGEMGRQEGFEKFIAGDVSPGELEERIQTAQTRIQNAPTQIKNALSEFYGAEITNGDVLAYVLDPNKALPQIKRKITAAEIGGAAAMAGLGATRERAEELETFGVTGAAAREGFQTVASVLPRATTLSQIYQKQGVGPYTQTTAEQEVFGLPSAVEAATRRRKLTELEQAAFSGQAGTTGGALARERAGSF